MVRKTVVAILTLCLAAGVLLAQGKKKDEDRNTRSLQGTVTDAADNAVAGAVVQIKNLKSLQIRSFITKEQGTYFFHGLSKDVDYEVKADFQNGSSPTRTLSAFDTRPQAVINLKLEDKK